MGLPKAVASFPVPPEPGHLGPLCPLAALTLPRTCPPPVTQCPAVGWVCVAGKGGYAGLSPPSFTFLGMKGFTPGCRIPGLLSRLHGSQAEAGGLSWDLLRAPYCPLLRPSCGCWGCTSRPLLSKASLCVPLPWASLIPPHLIREKAGLCSAWPGPRAGSERATGGFGRQHVEGWVWGVSPYPLPHPR